jgi:hypothetical protein
MDSDAYEDPSDEVVEDALCVQAALLEHKWVHTKQLLRIFPEEVRGDQMVVTSADGQLFLCSVDSAASKDSCFLDVRSAVVVEGVIIDASFVLKTLVCLVGAESQQRGASVANQICILKLGKHHGREEGLAVVNVLNTKDQCSGLCLSQNAKFFFTLLHREKMLAKFKVSEEVQYRIRFFWLILQCSEV